MIAAIGTGLCVFFAGVFSLSAVNKLRNLPAFARGVRAYGIVPDGLTKPLALAVALVETALIPAFVVRPVIAWPISILVLTVFGVAQARVIWSGQRVQCHCFNSTELVGIGSLGRVVWFLALAVVGLLIHAAPVVATVSDIASTAIVVAFCSIGSMWVRLIGSAGALEGASTS
jgi:hypothetical protein